eukprot:766393-Hanusia_phi.AAC.22
MLILTWERCKLKLSCHTGRFDPSNGVRMFGIALYAASPTRYIPRGKGCVEHIAPAIDPRRNATLSCTLPGFCILYHVKRREESQTILSL